MSQNLLSAAFVIGAFRVNSVRVYSINRPPDKCGEKIIFLLVQNICCEHPKQMFKLVDKNLFTILHSYCLYNLDLWHKGLDCL